METELARAYVYAISVDGIVRYIGKGTGNRLKQHRIAAQQLLKARERGEHPRSTLFYYRLAKAIIAGQQIEESILFSGLTDADAFELEIQEITARRGTVWNQADGGNAPPGTKGRVFGPHSAKHRAKISAAGKGRVRGPQSEEHRAKLSAAHHLYRHTSESRTKISAGNLGKVRSTEIREKMRVANLGKVLSPETRAKISASHLGRVRGPQSAEHRAKITASRKEREAQRRAA